MADNKDKTTSNDSSNTTDPSRRKFLKNTGIATGGVIGGALFGGLIGKSFNSDEETATEEKKVATPTEARMFFTRFEDFVVLQHAVECIYPENDNGPGAIELGVPYFIDKQLAGEWGSNGKDYRQGPFTNDSAEDASLNRGELFINGLRKINQESQERFDTTFDEAESDQQNEIIQDLEDDKIKMKGVKSSIFFTLLRDGTLEGAYSDPLYGGNRDMAGWKMKEYPGPVVSYGDIIDAEEFIKKDPVSLTDYQQK